MQFYHYTSLSHLDQIIKDKLINPFCCSRLSEIDNSKPLVWFTDTLDFGKPNRNGLPKEKAECAIAVESTFYRTIERWDKWAQRTKADKRMVKAIKQTGKNHRSWYVSERPITIDNNTSIIYRPDIAEQLKSK